MAAGQVAAELVEELLGRSGEDVSENAQRPVDVLFSPEIQKGCRVGQTANTIVAAALSADNALLLDAGEYAMGEPHGDPSGLGKVLNLPVTPRLAQDRLGD